MNKKTKTKIKGAAKFYAKHALEVAKGDCPENKSLLETYMDYSAPREWEESFQIDWESSEGEKPTEEMCDFFHSCMVDETDKIIGNPNGEFETARQAEAKYKVPQEMWVLFDIDNGDYEAERHKQGYVWFFRDKKSAEEHKKEQAARKYGAALIGPFKYKREE